jgi:hypothetical protein
MVCMVHGCGSVDNSGIGMRAIHYLIDCEGKTLRIAVPGIAATIGPTGHRARLVHAYHRTPGVWACPGVAARFGCSYRRDKRVIFSVLDRHGRYALWRGRSQAIGMLLSGIGCGVRAGTGNAAHRSAEQGRAVCGEAGHCVVVDSSAARARSSTPIHHLSGASPGPLPTE